MRRFLSEAISQTPGRRVVAALRRERIKPLSLVEYRDYLSTPPSRILFSRICQTRSGFPPPTPLSDGSLDPKVCPGAQRYTTRVPLFKVRSECQRREL